MSNDQTKELYMMLKAMNAIRELIKCVDQDGRFKMQFDCIHQDIGKGTLKAKSCGVGVLGNLIFNAATMEQASSMKEALLQMC